MVEDPNLAQHLAHFGINITQMEKVHLNEEFVWHLYTPNTDDAFLDTFEQRVKLDFIQILFH